MPASAISLGKEDIRNTTAFLSDVAEVCLELIAEIQSEDLTRRYGHPWIAHEDRRCELVILGMGKLGGREPNYHSDLDVVFVYEAEGSTQPIAAGRNSSQTTSNQHFFSELAQRIIKAGQSHRSPRATIRTRCPVASYRQERHAGRLAGRLPAIFRRRPGTAVGTSGTLPRPSDLWRRGGTPADA